MYTTDAVPNGSMTLTGKPRMEQLQLKGMSESLEIRHLNFLISYLVIFILSLYFAGFSGEIETIDFTRTQTHTHTKDRELKT